MSVKLVITIDTEEDCWNNYDRQINTVENIKQIPMLQKIFNRYGALPTYLISYPIVTNQGSSRILQEILDSGRCEIGTHCHPWNTPPFEEDISIRNSMLCNLPAELQYKKLENLHQTIVERFGLEPTSFRTGRWGFSSHVARAIYQLGYRVDSSITPLMDWTKHHGLDFSEAPFFPYRFDPDDILHAKEEGKLLEIPPSIGFLQTHIERCRKLRRFITSTPLYRFRLIGILDKLGLLNRRWLSPEHSTVEDMITLANALFKNGHKVLNLSFHSTTLLPGKTPFVRTMQDLSIFLKKIESFIQFAAGSNWKFSVLSSVVENQFTV